MSITVKLGEAEAVFTVGAIEDSINNYAAFCRDTDAKFGEHNNLHKGAMRDLLGARDTLVTALRSAGYPMSRAKEYDLSKPEWQDIH